MCSNVSFEIACLVELFLTNRTIKDRVMNVCARVTFEVPDLCERLAADLTGVWLQSCVQVYVLLELVLMRKLPVAMRADEYTFSSRRSRRCRIVEVYVARVCLTTHLSSWD